jgi:hypothetical protein
MEEFGSDCKLRRMMLSEKAYFNAAAENPQIFLVICKLCLFLFEPKCNILGFYKP